MFSIIRIIVFLCFIINLTVLVLGNGLTPIKKNIGYSRNDESLPFSERILRKTFDHDKVKQLNKITPFAENDIGYRLPNTTRPELYTISIVTRIDQNTFTFDGLVRINIVALETTKEIILHSRQLLILSSTIAKMSDPARPIPIGMVLVDPVTDFLTIRLAEGNVLEVGERYFIEIFYSGILREDDAGFYRSSYVNENGVTVYLATTQFESTDARHGFPCYDEPAYKARFNLAITHGENYTAISNTNVQSVVTNFGLETKTTTFEQTPLMSTYLIAFVISDFSSIRRTASGITHRSFARPNAAHLIQLTLDTAVSTLSALEEYLNITYTLSKMDQIGVPDFAAGAMENWGLVTYRESYFLFDEKVDSYRTKTGIVTVIAHEFAHQWFGNLVTPEWWTHIWLNEGFATLFEYFATDMIHPDWNMVDYFVVDVLQNVFNIDASESIRPMTHYVESPTDIDKLFDAIAYDKSGSVLRMIQNAITDATFRKGLNYYLVDRSFATANEEHLIEDLQKAVTEDEAIAKEINVYDIMVSWSHQSGFPLLHVSRNYAENSIRLYQERYLNNNPITTENKSTWWIPYNFVTARNPEFTDTKADDWLPQYVRSKTIVPTMEQNWTTNDWIIFNKQQTGYYRILYDTINYGLIANELYYGNHARIHYLNRAQLIDDAFTFARTNRLDWTIPFDIIKYLRKEIEYPPWRSFTNHLSYLQRFMPGLNNYPYYKQFMIDAFENVFTHTGIDDISNEPMLMKYKRTLAVNWACYFGSEICLQQANAKLNNLLNNGIQIHPNLQSVMYCAGARGGATFLPLYNKFIATTSSTERRNFISAMSCLPNESGLNQLLELTKEIQNINFNSISERVYVINSVSENSALGLLVSIQFLIDNNATAAQYFGRNNLVNIVYNMAYLASTNNLRLKINELVEILLSNDSITMTTANEANTIIFDNMKWHIFNGQTIDNWLSTFGFDDTTTTVVNNETTVNDETTTTTTEVIEITTPSSSSKFNVNMITIFILFGFQIYSANY